MFAAKNKSKILYTTLLFLSFVSVIICYARILPGLWAVWHSEEYSHGILIPFLCLFIGWHRLSEKKPSINSDPWGVPFILFGLSLLTISQLSAFEPPAHYGFIFTLAGLLLVYFGRLFLITVIPALLYLLFAIPIPKLLYVALSADLQLWSSTIGVLLLRLFGVPVFQEGNIVDLGGYKLQVIEACSGLRYLFPLMSFGYLVALLFKDKFWKRVLLFLSTVPITIFMNSLRIAAVGLTVNWWGPSMAEGVLHIFEGWFVFLLCILVLIGEARILAQIVHAPDTKGTFRYEYFGWPHGKLYSGQISIGWPSILSTTLSASFAFLVLSGLLDVRAEIIPRRPGLTNFPLQISGWVGHMRDLDDRELDQLKLTDYLDADFNRSDLSQPITLYTAYYASQRVGSSIHAPNNCLPGSGWEIETRNILPLKIGSEHLPLTRMVIRKGEEELLVYYWFQERGRILNDQYEAKWYLLVDSIKKHRTDGALIRLTTPLGRGGDLTLADQRMQGFLMGAYPLLLNFIPGK